jgi:hypothetical protein
MVYRNIYAFSCAIVVEVITVATNEGIIQKNHPKNATI